MKFGIQKDRKHAQCHKVSGLSSKPHSFETRSIWPESLEFQPLLSKSPQWEVRLLLCCISLLQVPLWKLIWVMIAYVKSERWHRAGMNIANLRRPVIHLFISSKFSFLYTSGIVPNIYSSFQICHLSVTISQCPIPLFQGKMETTEIRASRWLQIL